MSPRLLALTIVLLAALSMASALALPGSKPGLDITLPKPDIHIVARDISTPASSVSIPTLSSTSTALTDLLSRLLRRDACSDCAACYGTTCEGSTADW